MQRCFSLIDRTLSVVSTQEKKAKAADTSTISQSVLSVSRFNALNGSTPIRVVRSRWYEHASTSEPLRYTHIDLSLSVASTQTKQAKAADTIANSEANHRDTHATIERSRWHNSCLSTLKPLILA